MTKFSLEGLMPAGHSTVTDFIKQATGDSKYATLPWLAVEAALLVLVILSLIYHDRPVFVKRRPELPHAKPAYPLIGNALLLLDLLRGQAEQKGILHWMLNYQRKIGKGGMPFTFTLPGASFGGRATVINRPEYIQWAQKTNFENYDKGKAFRTNFADVLSEHGIFAADGEVWRKQRKMASHIFSVGNFRTHVQKTMQHDLELLMRLADDAQRKGATVNLPDVFFRFTLDTFATMAFSADLACLPPTVKGLEKEVEFAVAFDYAQTVINWRFFNPVWQALEMVSSTGRKMRSSIKVLRKTCFDIIDKRLAAQSSGEASGAVGSQGKDLLQLFMDQGLGREDLLPVVLNFIIAGRDTTAQALAWTFLELRNQPQVVAKIRAEANAVIGDRFMEYDDLKNMVYTQAVFCEVLRLHPSVPKNAKVAGKDDVIRPYAQDLDRGDKGASKGASKEITPDERLPDIRIQKGTTVVWSDWVMGRMPEIWGPDCEEFKPDRFLNKDGSLRTYSTYKFHAFNAGPRLCLGQTLATYEGCAVIVELLKKYDVVLNEQELKRNPPSYTDSLTLPMSNPYNASFKPVA